MNCVPSTVVIRGCFEHAYKQKVTWMNKKNFFLNTPRFCGFEHFCLSMLSYTTILQSQIKDSILMCKMFWIKNKQGSSE